MRFASIFFVLLVMACAERRAEQLKPPITVFAAASLARPLTTLSDSFERRALVPARAELGGSLEHSRKITDLGRTPDVLMIVDDEVLAALVPTHLDWYVRFATNRVVVAYSARSRHAASITAENWWQVLSRADVAVGRADPATAPAGKHALAAMQRAANYYKRPGLGDTLVARSPLKFLRPNATELAALLQTGEVDYVLDYESVARQYGFSFVTLPADLAPAVLYGISVPRPAQWPDAATRFAAYVLSDAGKRILRDANIDVMSVPVAVGTNVPREIADLVRTTTVNAATAAR